MNNSERSKRSSNREQQDKTAVQLAESKSSSRWDNVERMAKIFSLVGVPLVIAVTGFLIQNSLTIMSVRQQYVELAVSILAERKDEVDQALREWAVDLLADNSPTAFRHSVVQQLKTGQVSLPAPCAERSLIVYVSADPSSGPAPLYGVDLAAAVSGTATGPITYSFDCTDDGSWERTVTTTASIFVATDLCDYPHPGSYRGVIKVERCGLSFAGSVGILVQEGK